MLTTTAFLNKKEQQLAKAITQATRFLKNTALPRLRHPTEHPALQKHFLQGSFFTAFFICAQWRHNLGYEGQTGPSHAKVFCNKLRNSEFTAQAETPASNRIPGQTAASAPPIDDGSPKSMSNPGWTANFFPQCPRSSDPRHWFPHQSAGSSSR